MASSFSFDACVSSGKLNEVYVLGIFNFWYSWMSHFNCSNNGTPYMTHCYLLLAYRREGEAYTSIVYNV